MEKPILSRVGRVIKLENSTKIVYKIKLLEKFKFFLKKVLTVTFLRGKISQQAKM